MTKDLTELRATADWLDTLGVHVAADRIRSCADELAAALAEQGWRSMDSAPRDGTRILWCDVERTARIRWFMNVINWPEYDACFEAGWWMPLPPPPPGGGS